MKIFFYIKAIFFTLVIFISNRCSSQSYPIKSLDGENSIVLVNTDYVNNKLKIANDKDSLCILGFSDLEGKIESLGNFLRINYSLRSGSGIMSNYTLLIYIRKKHIYQAMHILSEYKENMTAVYDKTADSLHLFNEHRHYKINLEPENKNNTILKLNIFDTSLSKQYSSRNYKYNKQINLQFDEKANCFHTGWEQLAGEFKIYGPGIEESKLHLKGVFPVLLIKNTKYFLINDFWFEQGVGNHLLQYATACK